MKPLIFSPCAKLFNLVLASLFLMAAHDASFAASASEIAGLADMTRAATQRIAVQQAIITLASGGVDIDGDGFIETLPMLPGTGAPTGGGFIPLVSPAPKTDSYGVRLGYCAWDNEIGRAHV